MIRKERVEKWTKEKTGKAETTVLKFFNWRAGNCLFNLVSR